MAILLAVFVLALAVCWYVLLTFTVSLAVAFMLSGPHRRLTAHLRGRKGLAAAALLVACVLILLLPVIAYGGLFADQATSLVAWLEPRLAPEAMDVFWNETVPARYPTATKWVQRLSGGGSVRAGVELSGALRSYLGTFAQTAFVESVSMLMDLTLVLMFVFFLLRDGDQLAGAVRGVSPLTRGQETELLYHMNQTVKAVFLSMVLVPVAQGAVALPGFWALGLPAPVLWSALVILAALIPIVGSPLVWVPAGVYLIATGATGRGLGILVYGALIIATVDNVVKPLILREAAGVHTMLGFVFVLGGFYAFGPKGLIAGPIVLSLVISAYRIYRYDVLRWRVERPFEPAGGAAATGEAKPVRDVLSSAPPAVTP